MIAGFDERGTEDIWAGDDTKAARKVLPKKLWPRAVELLDQLDAAVTAADLRLPKSNRLHRLKEDLKDFWSVSVNMQYRIIFRFKDGQATEVGIVDYH